jgi:hypothetical protein
MRLGPIRAGRLASIDAVYIGLGRLHHALLLPAFLNKAVQPLATARAVFSPLRGRPKREPFGFAVHNFARAHVSIAPMCFAPTLSRKKCDV